MALTPDGMFYLGKEDLAGTTDLLGKSLRGMFGIKTKEEAVQDVLKKADYSTAEGRQAALNEIKSIDPEQWKNLSEENRKYEQSLTQGKIAQTQLESAEMKKEDLINKRLITKNTPILRQMFKNEGKPEAIRQMYLLKSYTDEQLEDAGVDVSKVKTDLNLRRALKKLGERAGDIGPTSKIVQGQIDEQEARYISSRALNPDLTAPQEEFSKSTLFEKSASDLAPLDALEQTTNTGTTNTGTTNTNILQGGTKEFVVPKQRGFINVEVDRMSPEEQQKTKEKILQFKDPYI